MSFRLMEKGWATELDRAVKADRSRIRVICPFIKERAASRLLQHGRPGSLQVITRFDLKCFLQQVSDIGALRLLLDAGASIRGVRNLHAKVYLVGKVRVIVTSANLTEQAFVRNHEFGFFASDDAIAAQCHDYFDRLWSRAGSDLDFARLKSWERVLATHAMAGTPSQTEGDLRDDGVKILSEDDGVELGFPIEAGDQSSGARTAEQGFVKFFGEGHNRQAHSLPVIEEVGRAGCHWACSYPTTKTPRRVHDGAVIFMGRLVDRPKDTMIFGRGIGLAYVPVRDDATREDIRKRPWKERWQRYIRVRDVEFIDGTLGDGISLSEMMEALGAQSFTSTERHSEEGAGNTDPRKAFNQQAAVELTPEAIAWLNDRLDRALAHRGKISRSQLAKLDWPKIPEVE